MNKWILSFALLLSAPLALAAGGQGLHLEKADVDLHDTDSLRRGAEAFHQYCFGCHSLGYMRYNRMGQDLGYSKEELEAQFVPMGQKVGDLIISAMPKDYAKKAFGTLPPDLTLETRVRGEDWVYTYLKSFYTDNTRPLGVNNVLFPKVGMPHVLESLQGTQLPVTQEVNGQSIVTGVEVTQGGSLEPAQYDALLRDIVAYLSYMAEPMKLQQRSLGIKVILFLLVLLVLAYLLKSEYWKDVK